jgi:hypothetical protein
MSTTTFLPAKWGTNPYARIDHIESVTTVAELTHRYAHGEVEDARQYLELLGVVVQKTVEEEGVRCKYNRFNTKRACMLRINKRLYGKTPLEMLISMESFVLLAQEDTPEAAYRLSLTRTFEGIFALYQAAGRYIDIDHNNSPYRDKYGTPDLQVNIAGLCAIFPVDVYDQTVTARGSLKFTINPRHTFVPREPCTPLVSSIVFNFIKFLWPKVPIEPELDPESMNEFEFVLQDRQNKSIDKVLKMFDMAPMENDNTNMRINVEEFLGLDKQVLDVRECISRMMTLRRYELPLTDKDIAAIAAADVVMIPIVTMWMNRAKTTGGMG